MRTFAERAEELRRDERRAELDYYELSRQLEVAAPDDRPRLYQAQQLAYRHWQGCQRDRAALANEQQDARLYRDRGA